MGEDIRQKMRIRVLANRDLLNVQDRHEKSTAITERILTMPEMGSWKTLFIYVNFRSEVETLQLIQKCLENGKRVAVPLVDSTQSTMIAFQVTDLEQDLRPGYFDIPEPDPARTSRVAGREIDVVMLPGSVFDPAGGRLGYGGGYYDRFLVNDAPLACRIGLAFEMQVVEAVPLEPHDQRLDYLVTEKRIIKTLPKT